MKRVTGLTAMWVALMIMYTSSAQSQIQEISGYTVIQGTSGSLICIGRWVPSTEVGRPGVCEGQMVETSQLTAISSKQTADKLDQLLFVLTSIDQKLTDNNFQIERLIEATINTQEAIDRQVTQVGELMHDTISSRVDALSRRVLANDTFRKELEKFKEDILTDIKKYYSRP